MGDSAQPVLLDYLTRRYGELKSRLARMLGNEDLADDALHDTYVRLRGLETEGPVHSPGAYLMRMAHNIAVDGQRRQRHTLSGEDIDNLLDEMADPAPGPERTIQDRSEVDALTAVMARMPERRRLVLVLVHWEEMTQQQAADRLGISLRTVASELKRAHETIAAFRAEEKK